MSERPKKTNQWLTKVTDDNQADLRRKLGRRFAQVHQRRRILRRAGGVVAFLIALSAVQFSIWNSNLFQNLDTADSHTSTVDASQKTQILDSLAKDEQIQDSQLEDKRHSQEHPPKTGVQLQLIDDNQLLDLLAEAGRPSVLVTIGGVKKALPLNKTAMK